MKDKVVVELELFLNRVVAMISDAAVQIGCAMSSTGADECSLQRLPLKNYDVGA